MPHEFRARKLAANFLVKIYTNLNNRITPKLQYVCESWTTLRDNNKLTPLQQIFKDFQQFRENNIRMPKIPIYNLTWDQITQHKNILIEDIELPDSGNYDRFITWYHFSQLTHLNIKEIYTDVSKQQAGVEAKIYSLALDIQQQYKLPSEASIFTAEIFAIRQALISVQQNDISDVVILTDSQSALKKLQSTYIDPYENWYITNIKQLIHKLVNKNIFIA